MSECNRLLGESQAIETSDSVSTTEVERLIQDLSEDQVLVEVSYDKSRKAIIAGSVLCTVGSTLCIVGTGMGFVTFGASVGLVIPGTLIAAAGGIIFASADLGYNRKAKDRLKHAKKKHEELSKKMGLDVVKPKNSISIKELIKTVYRFFKGNDAINIGKIFLNFVKGNFAVKDVVELVIKVAKSALTVGRPAWAVSNLISKIMSIGGAVFDIVFLPLNIAYMVKASYDVHKYKKTGISNSTIAEQIGEVIQQLRCLPDKNEVLMLTT